MDYSEVREKYDLRPTKSRRILEATPKQKTTNASKYYLLVIDTTKAKFKDIFYDLFFMPEVLHIFSLQGNGQNIFLEAECDIVGLIDQVVPVKNRSRQRYAKCLSCIADVRMWRFPNTWFCQSTEDALKFFSDTRVEWFNSLNMGRPATRRSKDSDGTEVLYAKDGDAIAVVYPSAYDVVVTLVGSPANIEDKIFVYGIDKATHNIVLKEF